MAKHSEKVGSYMQNLEEAHLWMRRALSNLERCRIGRSNDRIMFEDLCFDAQQAAEKSLKSVCILEGVIFRRIHDVSYLIDLLESNGLEIPEVVKEARYLTQFAVETRYPGIFEPVTEDEYADALSSAENVLHWACDHIGFKL